MAVRFGTRVYGLVKKPTRIRTTKMRLAVQIARRCSCVNLHVPLEGSLSKLAQNYPWPLAAELARLIFEPNYAHSENDDFDSIYDDTFPMHEDGSGTAEPYKELLTDLLRRYGMHVVAQVSKPHQQYDHPTRERLARELSDARLDPVLVACAKEFLCEVCLGRMRPKTVHVVAVVAAHNDIIEMDVFYVRALERQEATHLDHHGRVLALRPRRRGKG